MNFRVTLDYSRIVRFSRIDRLNGALKHRFLVVLVVYLINPEMSVLEVFITEITD